MPGNASIWTSAEEGSPAGPPATAPTVSVQRLWIGTSVLVSVLVTVTSLAGILLEQTYARETAAWAARPSPRTTRTWPWWRCSSSAHTMYGTVYVRNGSLRGYLVWLGAYLYLVYAFAIYAFAVHFNPLFLAYVAVLGLSFYTLVGGLMAARPETLAPALLGNPRARAVGVLLFVIGAMFAFLWLSEIVGSLLAGTVPASLAEAGLRTNPVYVLDLAFLLPGMIVTAVLLRRGAFPGYLMAVPLLVFSGAMGLGIIIVFALSALNGLPYPLPAGVVVGVIVVLSTVFAWLFLREVKEE